MEWPVRSDVDRTGDMNYDEDLNHRQRLETVPASLRQLVPAAVAAWDARADLFNKWPSLGWDERNALLHAQARATTSFDGCIGFSQPLRTST